MQEFRVHTPETAPDGSAGTLRMIANAYGFVPSLGAVIAESPAALNSMMAIASNFEHCSLSPAEQQIVMLTVSVLNECGYCSAAHSMLANQAGLTRDDVTRLNYDGTLSNKRFDILREFTSRIVQRQGRITNADIEMFFSAGFTHCHILDVITGIALKTLTNYVGLISKPESNEEFRLF